MDILLRESGDPNIGSIRSHLDNPLAMAIKTHDGKLIDLLLHSGASVSIQHLSQWEGEKVEFKDTEWQICMKVLSSVCFNDINKADDTEVVDLSDILMFQDKLWKVLRIVWLY